MALDQATQDLEEGDSEDKAQRFGMGDFRHQSARFKDDGENIQKAPERIEKKLRKMTMERHLDTMAAREGSLVTEQKR